ncbi:MAG: Asp-tRNA(Asn)/Glu-tRNA(Gln) amidotransferase subunit GatB [Deltaproteobacteria bacterium]|nr:Asp-tRNA(Asn)/Glu-tRNA(Gln) amidotransferase subunit GatB [Deltaproteobacteria bacterium]
MGYEAVIGLEIHAQLQTRTKLFCACPATFGAEPNTLTCPVCLGLPGALPVLNRRAVEFAIRAAGALGCTVHRESAFDRKSYFYPDLPKGYQITQYTRPLATGGGIETDMPDGVRSVPIRRIHIEEDAGRTVRGPAADRVLLDFNRAGTPLAEIVTEPAISSPAEAVACLKALRQILMYLEVCNGNMEEGSLRCEANVSVRPLGSTEHRPRTEIKNLNSFRFVERAMRIEIDRQVAVYEAGGAIEPRTMCYDENADSVRPTRPKEEAHDYRYVPEPDLQPLRLSDERIAEVAAEQPELPRARRARFETQYGLPRSAAEVLTAERPLADYFEDCVKLWLDPHAVAGWVMTDLLGGLGRDKVPVASCPVTPNNLVSLLKLIHKGEISHAMAREIFAEMYRSGSDAPTIVHEKGLAQVSDAAELRAVVEGIVDANPAQFDKYLAGNEKIIDFFMGELMKATMGRANPAVALEIIKRKLKK